MRAARTMTVANGPLPHVMASVMKGVTFSQICAWVGPAGTSTADIEAMPATAVAVFMRWKSFFIVVLCRDCCGVNLALLRQLLEKGCNINILGSFEHACRSGLRH